MRQPRTWSCRAMISKRRHVLAVGPQTTGDLQREPGLRAWLPRRWRSRRRWPMYGSLHKGLDCAVKKLTEKLQQLLSGFGSSSPALQEQFKVEQAVVVRLQSEQKAEPCPTWRSRFFDPSRRRETPCIESSGSVALICSPSVITSNARPSGRHLWICRWTLELWVVRFSLKGM